MGIAFYRSINVKKVMKLVAFIFEHSSYLYYYFESLRNYIRIFIYAPYALVAYILGQKRNAAMYEKCSLYKLCISLKNMQ